MMKIKDFLSKLFEWYLHASIHVALATSALVCMTFYFSKLPFDCNVLILVFSGTVFAYNFIKYYSVIQKKGFFTKALKGIGILSALSALSAAFCFINLKFQAQCVVLFFLSLCILYVIPVSKTGQNLRNWAGIKIYIVSLCWSGATLLIPLFNANAVMTSDVVFKFLQRFILTLILILIFEINDLKFDDPALKTVPQSIGVAKTKRLIYLLLLPFFVLELFKIGVQLPQVIINFILVLVIAAFTYFLHDKRSAYYTLFWVESIPILWLILMLVEGLIF